MHAIIQAEVINCMDCQQYKIKASWRYGHLTHNNRECTIPWTDIHANLIGLWSIDMKYPDGTTHPKEITALTVINIATQWNKIIPTIIISSFYIAKQFDTNYFYRYPRPKRVIFDTGGEFTGFEFQEILRSYSAKPVPTIVKNSRPISPSRMRILR